MSGPRYHRVRAENERFIAYECQECGWVSFPQEKTVCKRCGDPKPEYEETRLAERGTIQTFVIQEFLPDDFESPQPLAIVDIPQRDEDGESARVYGLLTETSLEELEIGMEVEARFREMFADGDRPVHSYKFSVPREEKA